MKWVLVFIYFIPLLYLIKYNKLFSDAYPGFITIAIIFLLQFL